MAKLRLSPAAKADLQEIAAYIAGKLQNPGAAARLLRRIRTETQKLKSFPAMGAPLRGESGGDEFRYIVCGSYLVFYRYDGVDTVSVDRVLYGRRDYLALLFGDQLETSEETDV